MFLNSNLKIASLNSQYLEKKQLECVVKANYDRRFNPYFINSAGEVYTVLEALMKAVTLLFRLRIKEALQVFKKDPLEAARSLKGIAKKAYESSGKMDRDSQQELFHQINQIILNKILSKTQLNAEEKKTFLINPLQWAEQEKAPFIPKNEDVTDLPRKDEIPPQNPLEKEIKAFEEEKEKVSLDWQETLNVFYGELGSADLDKKLITEYCEKFSKVHFEKSVPLLSKEQLTQHLEGLLQLKERIKNFKEHLQEWVNVFKQTLKKEQKILQEFLQNVPFENQSLFEDFRKRWMEKIALYALKLRTEETDVKYIRARTIIEKCTELYRFVLPGNLADYFSRIYFEVTLLKVHQSNQIKEWDSVLKEINTCIKKLEKIGGDVGIKAGLNQSLLDVFNHLDTFDQYDIRNNIIFSVLVELYKESKRIQLLIERATLFT